jgi:hypothetical protein
MVALLSVSVVETLRLSSRPEAADTFRAAPLATSADVFHGVRKAALVRVALPAGVAMVALIGFAVPGGRESLVTAVPLVLAIPTISLLPGIAGPYLPLSKPVVMGEVGGTNAFLMFAGMLMMAGVAVAGYLARRAGLLVPFVAIEATVLLAAHASALRTIRRCPIDGLA